MGDNKVAFSSIKRKDEGSVPKQSTSNFNNIKSKVDSMSKITKAMKKIAAANPLVQKIAKSFVKRDSKVNKNEDDEDEDDEDYIVADDDDDDEEAIDRIITKEGKEKDFIIDDEDEEDFIDLEHSVNGNDEEEEEEEAGEEEEEENEQNES